MSQTESLSSTAAESSHAAEATTEAAAASVVTALFDVGSAWARYGLRIGKLALETSAQTLTRTAGVLENLATGLERKDAPSAPAKDA